MQASLIIPAYNEEERLPATLETYEKAMLHRFGGDFELIVVANGCVDNTAGVVMEAAEVFPQIRIIDISEPIGKGGAVLEGFRQARGDGVLFADADGATTSESLLGLLDHLDSYDVVIGSRRMSTSVITKPQPFMRRVCGWGFAESARLLFGTTFKDTQCGAKAFRLAAARRLARVVSETRWTFDLDLLLSAKKLGLEVHEQPVVWADRAGSQLRYGSTTSEVLRALWAMRLRQSAPLVELPELPAIITNLEPDQDLGHQEAVA
ncbi:MAG: glycosyltransferase [Rubrobacteraceae bacterium]|nr:glycosyltransferase [Rubrobacteraceae bacterium]